MAQILFFISIGFIILFYGVYRLYGRWIRDFQPEPIDVLSFTWPELEAEIAAGNVSVRAHPDDPKLKIYNYTAQAQYGRVWNDVTKACRGLIIKNSIVLARPFSKFFNIGELEELPSGPFTVTEKEDGSLGVGYIGPDKRPAIATRGSFTSDQAEWATAFLRMNPDAEAFVKRCLRKGVTPLFEIVYPENRIVIDYGDRRDLILLATISIKTGLDVPLPKKAVWYGSKAAEVFVEKPEDLEALPPENREGFVLLFSDGTRVKYKFEQYVELHRILTGLTTRKIWDMVSQNIGVERAKEWVPDEFYQWMKGVADDLRKQFTEIENKAFAVYRKVDLKADRKTQAEFIKSQPLSGIVFKMLDGKEYKADIWKMVYPAADTAKVNDEAS